MASGAAPFQITSPVDVPPRMWCTGTSQAPRRKRGTGSFGMTVSRGASVIGAAMPVGGRAPATGSGTTPAQDHAAGRLAVAAGHVLQEFGRGQAGRQRARL